MTRTLAACLSAVLAVSVLGCGGGGDGGGGGGPGARPTPTKVQIDVSLKRTISEPDETTVVSWDVTVRDDDVPMNSAVVSINGKNVPRVIGFIDGWYNLDYEETPFHTVGEATYVPGADYAVTVQYDGATYTDTMRAPGAIVIDAAGNGVTWSENGDVEWISVRHLFGSETWSAPAVQPGSLTSPQAIPSSAYPTADTYQIVAGVNNQQRPPGGDPFYGYFSSLVGGDTAFVIEDVRVKRVTR